MAKRKKMDNTNTAKNVEKLNLSYVAGGNIKMEQQAWKIFGSFLKHALTIEPSSCNLGH